MYAADRQPYAQPIFTSSWAALFMRGRRVGYSKAAMRFQRLWRNLLDTEKPDHRDITKGQDPNEFPQTRNTARPHRTPSITRLS